MTASHEPAAESCSLMRRLDVLPVLLRGFSGMINVPSGTSYYFAGALALTVTSLLTPKALHWAGKEEAPMKVEVGIQGLLKVRSKVNDG